MPPSPDAAADAAAEVELLLEPRDGTPAPLISDADVAAYCAALAAGHGPVAVDAERASGYRYSQRAYLVQLRRAGAGTALIDPIAVPDLAPVSVALRGVQWVLHAANQDLPCLAELGMTPDLLFDTELAGRLAGFERVGLGPIVERLLGVRLEKGHSAADWSTRPLPPSWLTYAALDVEVLVELRDALAAELEQQGKADWAAQEFAALASAAPAAPRVDPWRRTSGIHRLRTRRQLGAVRALWHARDDVAARRDIAPGRVLPDAAIVAAAVGAPTTAAELVALPVFGGRANRRLTGTWFGALEQARALPEDELPGHTLASDAPPPVNRWSDRDPAAAARLVAARAGLAELALTHRLPVENIVLPDLVRRLMWEPPAAHDRTEVAARLRDGGARAWQVELATPVLTGALAAGYPPVTTTIVEE